MALFQWSIIGRVLLQHTSALWRVNGSVLTAIALLHYCTIALLHYCTIALLHHYTIALLHWSVIGSVKHWRRRKLWSLVTLSLLHCAPFIADHQDVDEDHEEDDHDEDHHNADDGHDEDDEHSDDIPADTAPFSLISILTIRIIVIVIIVNDFPLLEASKNNRSLIKPTITQNMRKRLGRMSPHLRGVMTLHVLVVKT